MKFIDRFWFMSTTLLIIKWLQNEYNRTHSKHVYDKYCTFMLNLEKLEINYKFSNEDIFKSVIAS